MTKETSPDPVVLRFTMGKKRKPDCSQLWGVIVSKRREGLDDASIWEVVKSHIKLTRLRVFIDAGWKPFINVEEDAGTVTIRVRKPTPVCPYAKKRMYSLAGARRSMAMAIGSGSSEIPKRMYRCDHCGSYHLTKKAL